jgi:hypothetical protein
MIHRSTITSLLTCVLVTTAVAVECVDYSLHVEIDPVLMPPSYQRSLAAGPDHLYILCSNPSRLVVLDAHQPWAPTIVHMDEDLPPDSGWVFVGGDLLFVTGGAWNTIHIYSLDDPQVPAYLATVSHGGSSRIFEYREPHLYTINDDDEFLVYDLTDPAAPVLAASPLAEHTFMGATVVDDLIYLSRNDAIMVCRLADPLAPALVTEVAVGTAWTFDRSGDVLYAASSYVLASLDVSDPAAPQILHHDTEYWSRNDIEAFGTTLLVHRQSDVWVYDVTDPSTPERRWEIPINGTISGMHVDSGHLYLMHRIFGSGESAVAIHELSAPLYPYRTELAIAWSRAVTVQGDLAYFATGSGLSIVDVSDLDAPVERSVLTVSNTSHWYDLIDVEWPWAVLSEHQFDPVFLIDVTDPDQPAVVDSLDLDNDYIEDIALQDGHLYMAAGSNFRAYEIAAGQFQQRDAYPTDYSHAYCVEPMGGLLLATTATKMTVFDISTPGQLDLIETHDHLGSTLIATRGSRLAIEGSFDGAIGLGFWDFVDPVEPVFLGAVAVSALDLTLTSTTAYAAAGPDGMHVIDISIPNDPRHLGSIPTNHGLGGVDHTDGGVILSGGGSCWIAWPHCDGVVSLEEPEADDLPAPLDLSLRAAPTPFNPHTEFRFDLPAATTVSVDIFDPRGRRVRSLVSEQRLPAGSHRVEWNGRQDDGRGLPSGTYLARIVTGDGRLAVTKAVLVR